MNAYFSTFPAGAEFIVEKTLKKRESNINVREVYSGLISYESIFSPHDIRQIRFFQNSFLSLYKTKETLSLREILNKLRTEKIFTESLKEVLPKGIKSFKIVASVENQTVAMPPIQSKKLESHIVNETGLLLAAKYPDVEIWIIQRREGFILIGLRITYPDHRVPKPKGGELSSQMANILCLVSEPLPKDMVLDPFAGYGGIVFERATAFPYQKIIAFEQEGALVKQMKVRAKNFGKNLIIEQGNAKSLKLADASVDVIITDPPWGMYEKGVEGDIQDLYQKILAEFQRVLVKDGRVIILTGAKEVFEAALSKFPELELKEKFNVLVSGKKAAIYKLKKLVN